MGRAYKELQFTKADESLLIRLVKENAEILLSQNHKPLEVAKRKEIWEWIAAELNATTSRVKRTGPEVQQKWQNLLLKGKKFGKIQSSILDLSSFDDIEELISDSDAEDFDDREYERKSAVFGQFAFTKAETKLLMARAAEHLDVLSSEKWADYKEKRRIWQDITDELNAKNPKVKRTIMQVRRKWVNVRAAENPPRIKLESVEGAVGDSPNDPQRKSPRQATAAKQPTPSTTAINKPKITRVTGRSTEDLHRQVLIEKLEVLKAQKEVWSTANEVLKTVGDKIQLLINLQPVTIVTEEQSHNQ